VSRPAGPPESETMRDTPQTTLNRSSSRPPVWVDERGRPVAVTRAVRGRKSREVSGVGASTATATGLGFRGRLDSRVITTCSKSRVRNRRTDSYANPVQAPEKLKRGGQLAARGHWRTSRDENFRGRVGDTVARGQPAARASGVVGTSTGRLLHACARAVGRIAVYAEFGLCYVPSVPAVGTPSSRCKIGRMGLYWP
jgi:hypothetical protein